MVMANPVIAGIKDVGSRVFGGFAECMWVIGNPLASTLAVISGVLSFTFTGVCVLVGALVFGAKNWRIPLWKRFYFCLAVVNIGIDRSCSPSICG